MEDIKIKETDSALAIVLPEGEEEAIMYLKGDYKLIGGTLMEAMQIKQDVRNSIFLAILGELDARGDEKELQSNLQKYFLKTIIK